MDTLLHGGKEPAPAASEEFRNIPEDARTGRMRPPEGRAVEIDGQVRRLSPGCQIRDAHNRIVMPVAVRDTFDVRYVLDAREQVHRVWLLARR